MANRHDVSREDRQARKLISAMSVVGLLLFGVLTLPALAVAQSVCGEDKPQTREIAFDAASEVTRSGNATVAASCGGDPTISCDPNNQPVHRELSISQHCVTVSGSAQSGFSFTADAVIATPQEIPFQSFGTTCTFVINSADTGAKTVQVTGNIVFAHDLFPSDEPGGTTVNRIRIDNLNVSGLDATDVQIHGGFQCQFLPVNVSLFQGVIRDAIEGRVFDDLRGVLCRECRRAFKTELGCAPLDPKLTYTRFDEPCRIMDTRLAGGPLVDASPRNFRVAGTVGFDLQGGRAGGCGVPLGDATAAMINFVAVNPSNAGNLRAASYPHTIPGTGSIINYQALIPALNVANGMVFPICDSSQDFCETADIKLQANGGSTHVVADVLGYFTRYPKEEARPFTVVRHVCGGAALGTTCTNVAMVTVEAPVAGRVVVRSNAVLAVPHANGATDSVFASINADSTSCQGEPDLGESGKAYIDASIPSGSYRPVITTQRTFTVSPGIYTFYLNGVIIPGSGVPTLHNAGIDATFYPD